MVISVNTETDHRLNHQELVFFCLVSDTSHVSDIPLFQRLKIPGMLSGF